MTGNDIIKALECCINADCVNCPKWSKDWYSGMCNDFLQDVLDLINRQRAEIAEYQKHIDNDIIYVKRVKSEAIKEFAERLKVNTFEVDDLNEETFYAVEVSYIDNLVKEMTEGTE